LSEKCEQSIVNNCTVNKLTGFGWWEDRNGAKVTYWNGDRPATDIGCQCQDDSSCANSNADMVTLCNCDSRAESMIDSGVITSKSQLPITKLLYGDSEKRYSYIKYSLGPLICSGKNGIYPSEEKLKYLNDQINARFECTDSEVSL